MSFKEFYKFYCPSKIKKNINAAAIMLYCCSILNFLLFFVSAKIGISGLVSVVDAVLVLGLALGGTYWQKSCLCGDCFSIFYSELPVLFGYNRAIRGICDYYCRGICDNFYLYGT